MHRRGFNAYMHGMVRFSNVRNKNNRRYKRVSNVRKAVNIICFILGIAIIIAVLAMGLAQMFIVGALFFFGVACVPLFMSIGKNMVMHETEIAANQKRAEQDLNFSVKKAMTGFFLMFTPLYVLMLGCFFIPVEDAWIVPYIPLFVFTLISVLLSAHTVEMLDFSMKKYKVVHTLLFIGIIVFGLLARGYFIFPYLNAQ